ncbi:GNAT family N-acetyltransferase [Ruminiclostridium cellobioparum]|nr:GNAT family N-acetyltransferase [Ruminiclostridium cellobioparum]
MDRNYFCTGRYMFEYYTDYNVLRKDFVPENKAGYFDIQLLTQDSAAIYMELHNEAFLSVPLSVLIDEGEMDRILADPNTDAGLFVKDGMIYGTFEIQYGDIPEISAFSISGSRQGQGYGKLALKTIEQYLESRGYNSVELSVAGRNKRACSLYSDCGYALKKHVSTWYTATK